MFNGNKEIWQKDIKSVFEKYKPETVINLAAQAGVRYSIENPGAYIDSNVVGFFNISAVHGMGNTLDEEELEKIELYNREW